MTYFHHLKRLYNTPLLIEPAAFDLVLLRWTQVLLGTSIKPSDSALTQRTQILLQEESSSPDSPEIELPYDKIGSIAIFPVHGTLTQRGHYNLAESSNFLGYNEIISAAGMAAADPDVSVTILEFDTPGGEAGGAFEAMRQLRKLSQVKPIYAMVNEVGCSSGYGLAAACTKVYATDAAITGSVGVIMRHADVSRMLANEGVAVTELYSGARKVDGSPYRALSDAARENYQRDLDRLHDIFVTLVAEHRGLSPNIVRSHEAGVFLGADAVSAGLVDEILPLSALMERIMIDTEPSTILIPDAESPSSGQNEPSDNAQEQTIVAEESRAVGAQESRARIKSILTHEHAAGMPKLAQYLAFDTEIETEVATGLLDAAVKDIPDVPDGDSSPFTQAMAAAGDSGVDSEFGDSGTATLTRADFEKLTPTERREHIRAGGSIR